ncbi:MAG: sodium:proton antiporter [Phycisphaerales bacterium]|nr:sodium:proton antiporter [Phycisphaerales bacterium]
MVPTRSKQPRLQLHLSHARSSGDAAATTPDRHFIAPKTLLAGTAVVIAVVVTSLFILAPFEMRTQPPHVTWPWAMPFAALLLAIATLPALMPAWWQRFHGWISGGLGIAAAALYMLRFGPGAVAQSAESLGTYVDFIIAIGTLFIIGSAIEVRIHCDPSPRVNVLCLLTGALLAGCLGTMGAAVLLARPFFRINRQHLAGRHVVFFVMIVANVGGAITPLGDPPLLLGFLSGVPFWWITMHAWPAWLLALTLLLAMFYALDSRATRRLPASPAPGAEPAVVISGLNQLAVLPLVLAALCLASPWREISLIVLAAASLLICPTSLRQANRFNFEPIVEVAVLFFGIFLTLAPVLNLLDNQSHNGQLAKYTSTPAASYLTTGLCSSVLDNAPTYMAMLHSQLITDTKPGTSNIAASVQIKINLRRTLPNTQEQIMTRLTDPNFARQLLAISLGAVFFGGLTWIGNGPNLLVRAIAQQEGAMCPGFLGYLFRYALPCLGTVLAIIGLLFFFR